MDGLIVAALLQPATIVTSVVILAVVQRTMDSVEGTLQHLDGATHPAHPRLVTAGVRSEKRSNLVIIRGWIATTIAAM